MSKQSIDLGSVANDGTGTNLRDGGDIINDNFAELYLLTFKWCGNVALGNTLSNLTGASGSGSGGAIKKADVFYNTLASSSLTAPDGSSLIPVGCWMIALQDTPTTINHFSFVNSVI
jgi:hypothetical protein